MKPFLQTKRLGFYITLSISLFDLVLALVYFLIYRGSNELNPFACFALLITGIISLGFTFIPKIGSVSRFLLLIGNA
ncbi:MAG: hypothetical protein IJS52_02120, partial [Bacilli bacterium]|nr:hypothetical protein [Bacilli bacterium]